MRVRFTKMQGAGNDFVVLDATRAPLAPTAAQIRRLGDRRYGVGADQVLLIAAAPADAAPGVDFGYRIFNGASGEEVEHCGNGARCVAHWLRARGLGRGDTVRVQTVNRVLALHTGRDGWPVVDMGEPVFDPARVPFDTAGLLPRREGAIDWWRLDGPALDGVASHRATSHRTLPGGTLPDGTPPELAVASMGNPHAVLRVADADAAPVAALGAHIEHHARFAARTNVGFVQVLARDAVRLRVWERDAGETLACGTGACAAVAVGIAAGWLDAVVRVQARGGELRIAWPGPGQALTMAGPAEMVFEGEIEL